MYKFINVSFILLAIVSTTISSKENYNKVIVIGAGPSGIAAATKLLKNGVESVVILEAENRIGGRVNSLIVGDKPSELGAEWCHGQDGNIVYEMAKDYDLLRDDDYNYQIFYSSEDDLDEEVASDFAQFLNKLEDYEVTEEDKELSLGQWIIKNYDKTVLEKYKNDRNKLKMAVDAIATLEGAIMTDHGAFSWFQKSIQTHYESTKVSTDLLWKGVGYTTIFKIMMLTYENNTDQLGILNKIHLNKTVSRIEWLQDESIAVTVKCKDGSTYKADHVIFTPSLGVLKANHSKLFKPALTMKKRSAISKMGFDGVMKILLYFPEKWWPSNFTTTFLIWTGEDKINMAHELGEGPTKNGVSWLTHVTVLDINQNNPNVLIAWLTGDIIREVERTEISVMQNGIEHLLQKFFGADYNITKLEEVIPSSWCTNPHFFGTYSYETVESIEMDVNCNQILSEPLSNYSGVPVLLFAGEATNPKHYATVHGAIETGYREAERLLNLFKNVSSK